jgi:hypothetical protein
MSIAFCNGLFTSVVEKPLRYERVCENHNLVQTSFVVVQRMPRIPLWVGLFTQSALPSAQHVAWEESAFSVTPYHFSGGVASAAKSGTSSMAAACNYYWIQALRFQPTVNSKKARTLTNSGTCRAYLLPLAFVSRHYSPRTTASLRVT